MEDFLQKLKKVVHIVLYGPAISQSDCRKAIQILQSLGYKVWSIDCHFFHINIIYFSSGDIHHYGLNRLLLCWHEIVLCFKICNYILVCLKQISLTVTETSFLAKDEYCTNYSNFWCANKQRLLSNISKIKFEINQNFGN